jgi:hypothetical protein
LLHRDGSIFTGLCLMHWDPKYLCCNVAPPHLLRFEYATW